MPAPTREEFLAEMAIEASRLERFARQLREGKWGKFDIEESIDRKGLGGSGEEKATIVIRASRIQGYGTGLDITIDEEPAPAPAHQFDGSWQPHPDPERRGVEHERYEVTCSGCGLTIVNPMDAHVIDHCPPVKALSEEWLTIMGHPVVCAPRQEEARPPVVEANGSNRAAER
jgi:hypothetical protein